MISEDRGPELLRVVTDTGEVDVPPVRKIKVSGLTTTDAASEIKKLLESYVTNTHRPDFSQACQFGFQAGLVYLTGEVRVVGSRTVR